MGVGGEDTREGEGRLGWAEIGRVEEEGAHRGEEAGEGTPGVWRGGPWKGGGTQPWNPPPGSGGAGGQGDLRPHSSPEVRVFPGRGAKELLEGVFP